MIGFLHMVCRLAVIIARNMDHSKRLKNEKKYDRLWFFFFFGTFPETTATDSLCHYINKWEEKPQNIHTNSEGAILKRDWRACLRRDLLLIIIVLAEKQRNWLGRRKHTSRLVFLLVFIWFHSWEKWTVKTDKSLHNTAVVLRWPSLILRKNLRNV